MIANVSVAILLANNVDTGSTKGLAMYFLGYLGVITFALIVARAVPERFTNAIASDFVRSFARIGVPVLAFTTLYHWIFPTSIRFSEHLADNIVLAILISWVSRVPMRTSQ